MGSMLLGVIRYKYANSVYTRPAESNCMKRFVGVTSFCSLICHPCMHAPSLARVFDGKSGGVSGMVCGEGVGRRSRGRDTARLNALLHDVIHSVLACGINSRIQRLPECYDCSYARWSTSSRFTSAAWASTSGGGTKWSRRGSLRKVRQDAGEKLVFPQQLSGRMHVETWAGGCREPQPEDFPGTGNQGKVCSVGIPSSDSFCHSLSVLLGPGSDIRMKMEWKVMSKTEKFWVCFLSRMLEVCGRGGYFRCLRALRTGNGRDRTTQRGRFQVVPRVPVRMRTGGAQLSGRILEGGAGHCWPVCGGLSHP